MRDNQFRSRAYRSPQSTAEAVAKYWRTGGTEFYAHDRFAGHIGTWSESARFVRYWPATDLHPLDAATVAIELRNRLLTHRELWRVVLEPYIGSANYLLPRNPVRQERLMVAYASSYPYPNAQIKRDGYLDINLERFRMFAEEEPEFVDVEQRRKRIDIFGERPLVSLDREELFRPSRRHGYFIDRTGNVRLGRLIPEPR